VQATSAASCYTILTEPHFDIAKDEVHHYSYAINAFVSSGGNFFAQCHGVETYDNGYPEDGVNPWNVDSNPMPQYSGQSGSTAGYYQGGIGNFMTTAGLSKNDLKVDNVDHYYYADLAIAQFEGPAQMDQGGSLQGMVVANGVYSDWEWFSHGIFEQANVAEASSGADEKLGTNQQGRWWRSRAAKYLRDPSHIAEAGRNVFYLGGHEYTGLQGPNPQDQLTRKVLSDL